MSLQIIPFLPEHLDQIHPREFEAQEMSTVEDWRATAQFYKKAGPAWTGVVGNELMGSCGLVILWNGVADCWMVTTELCEKYRISFHRAIKNNLDRVIHDMHLRRVQTAIRKDHLVSCRWIQCLGFIEEGMMPMYGPNGKDYVRFARCLS